MTRAALLTFSLLLVGCPSGEPVDTAESPDVPTDPFEYAVWRVEQQDEQVGVDLAALPRLADGVDDAELAAVQTLAEVVEAVVDEDPRAVALLRSLPAEGFVDAAEAPAIDGLDDDWARAPRITKSTGRVDADVDIMEVAGLLADDALHLMIRVDGELSDDVAVGFYLDHGEGTLGIEEVLLWNQLGHTYTYAYRWEGSALDAGWVATDNPSWGELAMDGSVAELALPIDEIAAGRGGGHLRIQAIAYNVETGAYDLAPYLTLRERVTHGPIEELLELSMVSDVSADPSLAVASALAEAPLRLIVQDDILEQVRADGATWFERGLDLDRLQSQSVWEKAAWSWRGLESILYGALPLYALPQALDAEGYAFDVLTVEQMDWWLALAESEGLVDQGSLDSTVAAMEDWMDEVQNYRTYTEAMEAFCAKGWLDEALCGDWREEVEAGDDHWGEVMGQTVFYYDNSVLVQQEMWETFGELYGDCGSHTTVVSTMLKGLGVPVAAGQYIADSGWVVHNFPIYLDTDAGLWRSYQLPCWASYANDEAAFYQFVAPRHFEDLFSVEFSSVPDYGGGLMHYHHTTFGDLCDRLADGIPVDELEQMSFERWWVDDL